MTLSILATKAAYILAIMGVMGGVVTWVNTYMSNYALAVDFERHVSRSDERVRFYLEDKILIVNNQLDVYQLLKAGALLKPVDRLKESQLINLKQKYLRQLKVDPR